MVASHTHKVTLPSAAGTTLFPVRQRGGEWFSVEGILHVYSHPAFLLLYIYAVHFDKIVKSLKLPSRIFPMFISSYHSFLYFSSLIRFFFLVFIDKLNYAYILSAGGFVKHLKCVYAYI
jgi:hypothetical protein